MPTRRQFLRAGAALAGAAAATGLYAWRIEPHWVELVERPMPLRNLPPELVGKTLLQISDMHVGFRVDSEYLIDALRTAAALGPDFVAVTGDLVTWRRRSDPEELARVLEHLPRGRLGTAVALGNHDYGPGWWRIDIADRITRIAEDAGATVLRNAITVAGGLQIVGLADFWSPEFGPFGAAPPPNITDALDPEPREPRPARASAGAEQTLRRVAPGLPTIVLAHNPDAQDVPIWDGIHGWVLAGHTHGGQVKPPFLPPPLIPCRNTRYTAGVFEVAPGRTLYINRGLGHLVRVRFNVRPEITLFTLQRAG